MIEDFHPAVQCSQNKMEKNITDVYIQT